MSYNNNNRFILQAVSVLTEYTELLSVVRNSQLPTTGILFEVCWTQWSRSEEEEKGGDCESPGFKFGPEEIQAVVNLHLLLHGEGEKVDFWKPAIERPAKESYNLAAYLARPMDPIPGKKQHFSCHIV